MAIDPTALQDTAKPQAGQNQSQSYSARYSWLYRLIVERPQTAAIKAKPDHEPTLPEENWRYQVTRSIHPRERSEESFTTKNFHSRWLRLFPPFSCTCKITLYTYKIITDYYLFKLFTLDLEVL